PSTMADALALHLRDEAAAALDQIVAVDDDSLGACLIAGYECGRMADLRLPDFVVHRRRPGAMHCPGEGISGKCRLRFFAAFIETGDTCLLLPHLKFMQRAISARIEANFPCLLDVECGFAIAERAGLHHHPRS